MSCFKAAGAKSSITASPSCWNSLLLIISTACFPAATHSPSSLPLKAWSTNVISSLSPREALRSHFPFISGISFETFLLTVRRWFFDSCSLENSFVSGSSVKDEPINAINPHIHTHSVLCNHSPQMGQQDPWGMIQFLHFEFIFPHLIFSFLTTSQVFSFDNLFVMTIEQSQDKSLI